MSEKGESKELDFPEQLSNHSEYFVIAGVFAAIATYVYQATDGFSGGPTSAGFVSSVSLFGLSFFMVVLFYQQLKREVDTWVDLYQAHFKPGNAELAIFSALLFICIMSILGTIPQLETGFVLFGVILYFLGLVYLSMRGGQVGLPRPP